jgi:hypothetical protein
VAKAAGTLCWTAIFDRQFVRAAEAGQEAVDHAARLGDKYLWVRLNFAHALMFLGKDTEAKDEYKRAGVPPKDIIRDFEQMRVHGLEMPLMKDVVASICAENKVDCHAVAD